jgi:hypothetical protein
VTRRTAQRAGRGSRLLSMLVLGLASGCLNQEIRYAARRSTNTLPDLQYQQVMDNLATIASNPHFLPYLAVPGQGTIQVTNSKNLSLGLDAPAMTLTPGLVSVGGAHNVTGTWSLGTITSPEKIRSMRAAYQRAVRGRAQGDAGYTWLGVGCKGDVPKQAIYVGRHGQVFVWVMPEGIAGLSDLTLTIMDIATREDGASVPNRPLEPLLQLLAPTAVPRRNFQVPPTGPVFTPGVN